MSRKRGATLQMTLSVPGRYNIIGQSPPMQKVFDYIAKVALTDETVLITGESGTGKELVAQAIHHESPRSGKPMIVVNCDSIPATLCESQFFGHCKGAFTDAKEEHKGVFEQADGSTLLLDEIGEIPLDVQPKLLRAVETKRITPLCGTEKRVDVRIIAATSRDLRELIKVERFRPELFYRLRVTEINLVPLRERKEDIPLLIKHFLGIYRQEFQRPIELADDAIALLIDYSWPGNVRKLENLLKTVVIYEADAAVLAASKLKPHLEKVLQSYAGKFLPLKSALENYERDYILNILQFCQNDKEAAARLLGIDVSTLYRRLKRYKIP